MGLFKRLDLTNIDFTKKENQTFRNWFALMWQNGYLQVFVLAIGFIIGILATGPALLALIPLAICGVIGYKGFYQFWDDTKKDISR